MIQILFFVNVQIHVKHSIIVIREDVILIINMEKNQIQNIVKYIIVNIEFYCYTFLFNLFTFLFTFLFIFFTSSLFFS